MAPKAEREPIAACEEWYSEAVERRVAVYGSPDEAEDSLIGDIAAGRVPYSYLNADRVAATSATLVRRALRESTPAVVSAFQRPERNVTRRPADNVLPRAPGGRDAHRRPAKEQWTPAQTLASKRWFARLR
jgi:hypothetical protein